MGMLTVLFLIMMFGVFGKMIGMAIRMTWGITKVIFTLVFLPLILIGMAFTGLVTLAIPILLVIGAIALMSSLSEV